MYLIHLETKNCEINYSKSMALTEAELGSKPGKGTTFPAKKEMSEQGCGTNPYKKGTLQHYQM